MKRNRRFFSVYGVATILSLMAHVWFLALLEGALLLTQIRFNMPHEARILFETGELQPAEGESGVESARPKRQYPDHRSRLNETSVERTRVPHDRFGKKAQWRTGIQSFEAIQADLDQRLESIKARLNTWETEHEVASIYVSDPERVSQESLGAWREGRMRNYLKEMRAKIRKLWLEKIRLQDIRPGVVTIQYRIHLSGTISNLKTLFLEGDRRFSHSCLAAVEEASPFGVLPAEPAPDRKERFLTVKLTFYLRGYGRHENVTSVA
ncbi:MAG: hypothetical protein A3G87_05160 [Omnitrophica bacterium RIFCSPLOWO2_12_FULL_50_11]|nr:MAG: hypothetical protein A3G87_05160 [Omnitrophica bacterium RIFCSPLOWO2_12_FULL_50_11]